MEIDRAELESIYVALKNATQFFAVRDDQNARMNCLAVTNYSPLTKQVMNGRDRLAGILGVDQIS